MFLRYLCCFFFLFTATASAEPSHTAGFQTVGIWEPERGLRLDAALWYPARRAVSDLTYEDWSFRAARGAAPAAGRHPLILLSHDTAGSRFTLHYLAESLARSGFVVAAPTHSGDSMDDMRHLFSTSQLVVRARELSALLDVLLAGEHAAMIDPSRVGVVGVGPGASAALLVAGARLDGSGWASYCRRAGAADPYCSSWVLPRMEVMAEESYEASYTLADPRFKAAVLAAPAYGMFFSRRALANVRTPILLMRADLDQINRAPHHALAIQDALPSPPDFTVLEHTDKPSLMAPCSPALTRMLPDLCVPAPTANRDSARTQFSERTQRFLLKHLGQQSEVPQPEVTAP